MNGKIYFFRQKANAIAKGRGLAMKYASTTKPEEQNLVAKTKPRNIDSIEGLQLAINDMPHSINAKQGRKERRLKEKIPKNIIKFRRHYSEEEEVQGKI
jgi:hypothetical protein